MSHPVEELTGQEVHVAIHKRPGCKVEFYIKASPNLVQMARRNAVKTVSKEVSLPGFRKGKAPDEMILKKFSNDVEKQLHRALADLAFLEAQKIAKVSVLNNNSPVSFDLKKQGPEGAELIFSFETEPQIPVVDPAAFQPKPVEKAEVGEKQLEEAIRQMMFFYANWKPIAERGIQEGDYIMIDLDTVDGETTQRVFNHIRFEVSSQRMANWMKQLTIGAKSGDVLEGLSEADDTATEEEKREFKPKKVRISVLKVEEAILPELNDEFAKKVGAANVADMRASIERMLNAQADQKVEQDLRDQINLFLVEQYPFDLPLSLVDAEKKHRIQQLMRDPKFKKDWNGLSEEDRKKLDASLTQESAEAVRLFYLSRKVVHEAKIPITQQEVQDEAIATLQAQGRRSVEVDQIPKEVYALALSKVILAKAQTQILHVKK